MEAAARCLGVDIGGTHLRMALVDGEGNLLRSVRYILDDRSPEGLLGLITQGHDELEVETPGALPLGVGLAAQIWTKTGVVAVAPNLGWTDVPFGSLLKARFGAHVRMINDLNAIAVGEALRGSGAGAGDVLCIFVGTGVGMGAIVGGRVLEGADGVATELGHTKVASVQNGRLCGCGERGCLEAYTSGRHLPDLLAGKVASGTPSPLFDSVKGNLSELNAKNMDAAVVAGQDRAVSGLWDEISMMLGRSLGDMITIFNPKVLVLGGGVLLMAPTLRQKVVDRIRAHAARPALKNLTICDTALGDDAGIIGAALTALHG